MVQKMEYKKSKKRVENGVQKEQYGVENGVQKSKNGVENGVQKEQYGVGVNLGVPRCTWSTFGVKKE